MATLCLCGANPRVTLGAELLGAQERVAQNDLSGTVRDATTGAAVSGALVVWERGSVALGAAALDAVAVPVPEGRPALTDEEGRFRILEVPEGLLVLRIEHIAYGMHRHPLRVEGGGSGLVEILLSPAAIVLEPLLVEARLTGDPGSPSSRNVLERDRIGPAATSGVTLGEFLAREVSGMYTRRSAQLGGPVCLEFRGARRGDGPCRPPQVYMDGTAVPDPQDFFGYFSLDGLERIRVVAPSEAGTRFGPNSGWGVLLLETRMPGLEGAGEIPTVLRASDRPELVDWSFETEPYPWGRVYGAAVLGNAAGLAAASVVMSRCMDMRTRRFYRGPDSCGPGLMLAAGVTMTILPALGGSWAARLAGSTPRSRGRIDRSILYSLPVFVPGFALASVHAGESGLRGADLLGVVLVTLGAPLLNAVADHAFRKAR